MTTRATNNQGKTMHIEKFVATVIQLWQIMEIEMNEGRKNGWNKNKNTRK